MAFSVDILQSQDGAWPLWPAWGPSHHGCCFRVPLGVLGAHIQILGHCALLTSGRIEETFLDVMEETL